MSLMYIKNTLKEIGDPNKSLMAITKGNERASQMMWVTASVRIPTHVVSLNDNDSKATNVNLTDTDIPKLPLLALPLPLIGTPYRIALKTFIYCMFACFCT